MNDEKFEDGFEHNNYDYTLLDTHYESRENKIIEWNKHSSNAEYFNNDLKGIAELLNIKQMKLESVEKYDVRIGELFDKIESLEKENEKLKQDQRVIGETLDSIILERDTLSKENEHFRKSRDKWKVKALRKDEQLKDCDNDCFNCRFYNKVCDFCTKFHIYTMTSDKDE